MGSENKSVLEESSKMDEAKEKGALNKTFGVQDERGIGLQIYTVAVLVMDIMILLFKMLLVNLEFIYRLVFPIELKDIKNEIVLITGSGHGIGRELSLQYAAFGCTVVCVDINQKGNLDTVQEIKEKGGKAHAFVCDVSNQEKVMEMADAVRREVGEVTVLVNNAGIMPCKKFLDHTEEDIKKIFDVNVFAHFWLLKAFLPSMTTRNHGHIVALSSMAGVIGIPNLVPYCGSKFAVRGIMESLHEELREDSRKLDIKFTCIYPYIVDTGLCQKPRIRFPKLLAMVAPHEAASLIIEAMRRNRLEVSIPYSLLCINNWARMHPNKIGILLKDFIDSGLDPHV